MYRASTSLARTAVRKRAFSVAGRTWRSTASKDVVRGFSASTLSSGGVNGAGLDQKNRRRQQKLSTAAAALHQAPSPEHDTVSELERMNGELSSLEQDPLSVLRWALEEFDGRLAMSTSFGIQSAVLLHLATQVKPDIPVVWVDTGYLPPETYQYAETLRETLNLNLTVSTNSQWSAARMEALYGKLWEAEDAESHSLYGRLTKVEPMQAGLESLEPNPLVLLSGLRASQTKARANMKPIGFQQGRFKLLPMLRMTDDDVADYMDRFDLPAHPLQAKGYATVGDWHSSRPVQEGEDPRNTRFGGKFQECGLHVESHEPVETPAPAPSVAVAAKPAKASKPAQPEVLKPESLEKTGVKALALTRHHPETDIACIMVKKLTEDGSYCRKCNDVAEKIVKDSVEDWIGYTAVADVLDPSSEGAVLAKHFGVATAPFFLVRDAETESADGEWKVVRSYLQLRKQLEKAADHKLATVEAATPEAHAKAEHDPALLEAKVNFDSLKAEIAKLQVELREKQNAAIAAEKQVHGRAAELGLE
ncbi:Phosphoadenosine phosphosulfate reductase [Hondaea fermentalgiana]|uniref:Phosphoadenosine phosphosulfate reductase n=1 Tax=Hondaea fermentalgiana TaxID=2315210 RepID=A0A2R5GUJ9_9STRA|nr:Phosphoadenosine phosphosulfate reductase [Hondaea fermentalgiana]|eukprot:GBG33438.1 Phosphoadenosine phosphosulfate reductase [Hondaea fermentalgiana]